MSSSAPVRALFLDRDGVINVDHGYVSTPERTEFVEGIFELVTAANVLGYLVIVITNQAGIARGYYSEDDFRAYMAWVRGEFARHGARIDDVFYCPHHPDAGLGPYRQQCICRKPAPGMLLDAQRKFGIDLSQSLLVGDMPTDIEAAKAAGVGTAVLLGSEPCINLYDVIHLLKGDLQTR